MSRPKRKTAKRDDIHRPGEIDPSEYRHLWSFSYPGTDGFGYGLAMLTSMRTGLPQREPVFAVSPAGTIVRIDTKEFMSPWGKLPFFEKANEAGGCDICGARFVHGDAFQHVPTGEVVLIGNICADKMGLRANRGDWTRNQKLMARLKKDAACIARRAELAALRRLDALKFLEAHEGLEAVLKGEHHILRDLASKLDQYGSLSPKQVELAFKISSDIAQAAAREASGEVLPEIEPPAGRRAIEGVVVGTKVQDDDFNGCTYRMLVEVTEAGARYRLFGTVPSIIMPKGLLSDLKGSRVKFTAEVRPKEKGFGFFSRPASAQILSEVKS